VPALSSSPIRPALEQLSDLPASYRTLLAGQCPGLLEYLARVPDPRDPRGVRHTLTSLLLAAVAAVLAGAKSFTAVGEWVADAPPQVLAALGVRRDPLAGRFEPPDEATIRRVLETVDAAALDAAVGSWLEAQVRLRDAGQGREHGRRRRRAVAVDGKAVRGTRHASSDGQAVHLLAALDQRAGAVLAQGSVDGKTNEVRHEAPCHIPGLAGMNSEGGSWARRLTWIRKVKGTRACRNSRWPCPDAWSGAEVSPRDMAKAELPESQSPVMQVFIHRKWRLKPVPRPVSVYFVGGCTFRDVGRCPVRALKGMSETPKSRYYVWQGRTWDRLRDASPRATECS
jgi:hypothetical protein